MIEGFDGYDHDNTPANTRDSIAREFAPRIDWEPDPSFTIDYADIKVAVYDQPPYQGEAFVLYLDTRDGQFYEVNASHCSCYGLENQWRPERINTKELRDRPSYIGWIPTWESDNPEYEYAVANRRIREAVIEALEGVAQE